MTVTDTTTTTAHLDPDHVGTIVEMLQRGRRVSEVIAAGLNVHGGWRRNDVIDVVSARGWKLDSDGRIPARFRSAVQPPTDTVRGAPAPVGGRPAPWPEHGTRQDPPLRAVPGAAPPADSASALLNAGKGHSQPRVRKLAEKAEAALIALRAALSQESEREKVRARLAELDAERDALRAKLAGPGRPPRVKTGPTTAAASTPAADRPIEHGTWGGFLKEKRRGIDHCQPCLAAKDQQMDKLHGHRRAAADQEANQ